MNRLSLHALLLHLALVSLAGSTPLHAAGPAVSTYPAVSANPIVADGSTQYTVSYTVSHASGYSQIICMRLLFDHSRSGGDSSKGRGYMAWGANDATMTKYGGTWVLADANEGRWGYLSDNWGGTTYITPVSCSVVNTGKSSGGAGYKTVTWTFTASSAWAANPLTNCADCWVEDASGNKVGWCPNPNEFDVVGAACSSQAVTPGAPAVSNATVNTVQIAINPTDSESDVFCIRIMPSYDNKNYVQADGTLGLNAVWQSKTTWGTKTVTGLVGGISYGFKIRAWNTMPGVCPSAFGNSSTIATLTETHEINAAVTGTVMHRGVIGDATRLDTQVATTKSWDILYNTFARGIAGGLDADTYNWKDMGGQGVGHTGTPPSTVPTTLDWMRKIRDHGSTALITANLRGIGPVSASGYGRFYYTDTSVATVKQLAADWVRYINYILPTYRAGDTLPASDQAILDSINWYGRQKLLSPGETSTPKVTYWEIGNEPEVPLPWSTPSVPTYSYDGPTYASRYKDIAAAMLAVDPTIKVGPCMLSPNPTLATLDAVLTDHTLPVDFIAYHPYGPIQAYAMAAGDTPAGSEAGLRAVKSQLQTAHANVISSITRCGRSPSNILTIASEYNPSNWTWEGSPQIRRVAQGLGVAETLFSFTELGLFAATYWGSPAWSDGTETPGYKVFAMAQQHWGESLVDSYTDGLNFRMYTTWSPKTQDICIWALNFSQDCDKPVQIALNGVGPISSVTQKRLQKLMGATSLLDTNEPPPTNPPAVDWVVTDLTGAITPSNFTMAFPRATITVLVFHLGSTSLSQAKSLDRSCLAVIEGSVVSGVFSDAVYVQEPDRKSGLRVLGDLSLRVGDVVKVLGRTALDGKEVALKDAVVLDVAHGGEPDPLFLNNKATGGSASGLQPATIDQASKPVGRLGSGLNPMGLLMTTTGQVTYVDPSYTFCYIDDGSNLDDGSGCRGMRVLLLDGQPIPPVGASAVITGCGGAVDVAGNCARCLRPRSAADSRFHAASDWGIVNAGFEDYLFPPWVVGSGARLRGAGWASINPHSGTVFCGVYGVKPNAYAGYLRQVVCVPPGNYTASVWSIVSHTGTTNAEACRNRIGIDPEGGIDPAAQSVVWSDWDSTTGTTTTPWRRITTPAVPVAGDSCTVYLQYSQTDSTTNHISCFDDASLVAQ